MFVITDNKKWKAAYMLFSLLCLIAISVCLICDLAVNKHLSWSIYVLSAVPFAWAVKTPLFLVKRPKIAATLAAFTVLLLPFLFALERTTPVGGWFSPLAVPLSIIGITAFWITYCLFRFLKNKLNLWYLSGSMVFLYGIVATFATKVVVSDFLSQKIFTLDTIINLLSCIVITALLCFIGYSRRVKKDEA